MKRIRANLLSLLFALAPLASAVAGDKIPVPLPDRNPQRPAEAKPSPGETASAEAPASATTSETQNSAVESTPAPESVSEIAKTSGPLAALPARNPIATEAKALPLPERKPATASVAMTPPESQPQPSAPSQVMPGVADIALPDRNPKSVSLLAPPTLPEPAPLVVTDMPLPDPNPNRPGALPLAMKGTIAPAVPPARPAMDYESILKPILSYNITASDEAYLREVIRASTAAAARIKDPAVRDFALWYKYRNSPANGDANAIEQFRLAHPDWPGQEELREKAEAALFLTNADTDTVKAFFNRDAPQTGAGKAALAAVYKKEGNEAAARELVISAWRDHTLNAAIEKKILDLYGGWLTPEHHRARIDRLLYPDEEAATEAALRVAKLLSEEEQKKVAARIAVIKRGGNAGKLLNALPANAIEADVGLRFNRIQWLRRTKDKQRREEAWKILLDTPSEPNVLLDLNNWWTERRINCRGALNDGNPKVAYEIAAKHGLASGDSFIEAEFLAGWIALRFLDDPQRALRHFLALRAAATSSKSIALGEYWLGRTALALGDKPSAMVHFHRAAKYPQHFYGQLARQSIDARPAHLEVTRTPLPTQAD
ncbi:MAG TPA: hypothetical protein VNJ31_00835, partial [Methyloceanibacter sp.]|nr:hypothetical protein [Methyloceanibacter sp.]